MDNSVIYWGIILLGLAIGLAIIIFSNKKINKRIEHYERIRDELTLRRKKPEKLREAVKEVEGLEGIGFSWGSIISTFIVILVGINLIPSITEEVTKAQVNTTLRDSTSAILGLVPIFFIIGIILTTIYTSVSVLKKISKEREMKEEVKKGIEHYESIRDGLTRR